MKKRVLILSVILLVLAIGLFVLTGCKDKKEETNVTTNEITETGESNVTTNEIAEREESKTETGTAGSNIPLKDNNEEAEYQIKVAMQNLFEETYGDKVFDARIYVEKIYTTEDEEKVDVLKDMKLGPNEVAFEVRFDLKPTEGADAVELSIPNGEYDEESGWIENNTRVGILRPNDSGEPEYKITDYGTGW